MCLDVSKHMANMNRSIGIGQGFGYKYLFIFKIHDVLIILPEFH